MTVGGSHAGAEIMLLTITSGARFVEVPRQLPAAGRASPPSPATAWWRSRVGLRMIQLILAIRRTQPAPARAAAGLHVARPAAGDEAHEQLPL